jgi:hypothetical protein
MEEKIPHTVSPLEKRVVKEKLDLDKKISALAAFLKGAKRTDLLRRDKRILEQQLLNKLRDPFWRLNHLYHIKSGG